MTSLQRLREAAPNWSTIKSSNSTRLRIEVKQPEADGTPGKRAFDLSVTQHRGGHVTIQETAKREQLPTCCVERHINRDGTFCLYLASTDPIADEADAQRWWSGLRDFLNHQGFVERRGFWPPNAQLSHGNAAADTQIEMERLAGLHGFRQEVLDGIFLNKGWLGEHLPGLSKSSEKVINSRGACPRLCLNRHRPAYRKDCLKKRCTDECPKTHRPITRADCPMREGVEALVLLEHKRRKQEGQFVTYLKNEGVECCGTVSRCPLRK